MVVDRRLPGHFLHSKTALYEASSSEVGGTDTLVGAEDYAQAEVEIDPQSPLHDNLARVLGIESMIEHAPYEVIQETLEGIQKGAKEFAHAMRTARAKFDAMTTVNNSDKATKSRFGFTKHEKTVERTDYPMWIIRDDEDYSGRNLKRGGQYVGIRNTKWFDHRCVAVDAEGNLLFLKKTSGEWNLDFAIDPEMRLFQYEGSESLAKAENLLDTAKATPEDLELMVRTWQTDLVKAAAKYRDPKPPRPEDYSLLPTRIV